MSIPVEKLKLCRECGAVLLPETETLHSQWHKKIDQAFRDARRRALH